MKFETITFTVKAPKRRVHKALFERDTPFKPKQQALKTDYRRKPKHNRWENYE